MPADSTFAIVAISSGLVGLAGIIVPARSADRRLDREIERDRERHQETLTAEAASERREARRAVLEDAATTFRQILGAASKIRVIIGAPKSLIEPGTSAEFNAIAPELSAIGARLQIWFPDESGVVQTFRDALASIMVYKDTLTSRDPSAERDWASEFGDKLDAFGAAARRYLDGEHDSST